MDLARRRSLLLSLFGISLSLAVLILALFSFEGAHAGVRSASVGVESSVPMASKAKGGTKAKKRRHCTKRQIRKGRCARTRTTKKQDSRRGPQIDPLAPSDGRGAGPSGTQGAIDWALAQSGRTDYYWWCLRFVANAFGAQFAGFDSPVAMMAVRGANRGEPPVGSLVLYGAVSGNPYGHVGIYLGNNKMINALQTVRISPLSYIPNYRGWLPAPSNWPGRPPTNPAPEYVAPGHTPPAAQKPAGTAVAIVVDNRVTNGMGMREDPTPVRLQTKAWIFCGSRGCNINGTERGSGGVYDAAVCQLSGERTTNGHDTSAADDANPARFESTRYYGVRLSNGTFGYVSETWIRADFRGGLGLPNC